MLKLLRRNFLIGASCAAALMAGAPAAFAAQVELGFLVDNNPATVKFSQALIDAFMAKNPDIKINLDTRPGGTEGDNLIKTKLATDDMDDVFLYNAGSLFQAMNPQKNLVDLTNEPFQANVLDSFKTVVTNGGKVFGAPIQGAMGGGVLYNNKVYAELGLRVPQTWADFMENNATIKAKGGIVPVIQTFKDTWTSSSSCSAIFSTSCRPTRTSPTTIPPTEPN